MDHEDIKPSCQRCIKIEAKTAEVEAAIVRNAQLVDELEAQLHPKPEPTDDVAPFVGVTSRQTPEELRAMAQRLFAPSWRSKHKGSKARRVRSHA